MTTLLSGLIGKEFLIFDLRFSIDDRNILAAYCDMRKPAPAKAPISYLPVGAPNYSNLSLINCWCLTLYFHYHTVFGDKNFVPEDLTSLLQFALGIAEDGPAVMGKAKLAEAFP